MDLPIDLPIDLPMDLSIGRVLTGKLLIIEWFAASCKMRWSRLSQQVFRVDKWSLGRGWAAKRRGNGVKWIITRFTDGRDPRPRSRGK